MSPNKSVRSYLVFVLGALLALMHAPYARAQTTYDITFSPGVDASVCNGGHQAGFDNQGFTTDSSGHFSTVWSTSTPVVSAVGDVSATNASATMSCLQTGSATGSIQATRPSGTGSYTGTYTFSFNNQTGQVVISPRLPTLSIADVAITEGNSGTQLMTFTLTLSFASSSPITYDIFTFDDTAKAGSDYVARSLTGQTIPAGQTSAIFAVTINGDTIGEANELFNVYLNHVVGATVPDNFTVGRIDNDDAPSLSIGDVSIGEGNSGTQLMTFTVSLLPASNVAVTYDIATINGTATAGSDFVASSLTGQSIPAGQTSKTFAVTVNGDTTVEPNEAFTVNLSNASGATVADAQAIGTISNDDATNLSIGDVAISEGNSGTKLMTFTVSLSQVSASNVTYNVSTPSSGTATANVDYVTLPVTAQSIPAGQTSKTISVTINGDTAIEANEAFFVNVTSVVGATVADPTAVGTIVNDDLPAISIGDVSLTEGNSGTKLMTFTVQLSAASFSAVTYNVATPTSGSATAGSDYVTLPVTAQSIPAGQTSKTVSVTINGDATIEANESFFVNVTSVVGATVADPTAVGTISNDDFPSLSIGDVSLSEGNSGTKLMTFTVQLSAAAGTPVTYNVSTPTSGSATANVDYVTLPVTAQTILAGQSSKTISVTINGDTTPEANESFFVNVSSVHGATVTDPTAVGTILNDDGAALRIASVATGGIYDDIDDSNGAPRLSKNDYILLLQDTAQRICRRAGSATIVAVDGVENRAVLADLADATNLTCNTQPHYAAVMAPGDSRGFLIEAPTPNSGLQVLGKPETFTDADSTALGVLGVGQAQPITVLLASEPEGTPPVRRAHAQALVQRVQQQIAHDANANVIVLGAHAVNGLVDLTVRAQPPANLRGSVWPNDRILVSPGLLQQFRAHAEFLSLPTTDEPAQYLQLQQ